MKRLLKQILWLAIIVVFSALLLGGYLLIKQWSNPAEAVVADTSSSDSTAPPVMDAAAGEEKQAAGPIAPAFLSARIAALGRNFDGDVGIAVQSLDGGWVADFNGHRPMPQQSVSKLWVAASLLDRVDAGEISLSDRVVLTPSDLTIFHQPIRKRIGGGAYETTISELLKYAMQHSDNTANHALFRRVGGKAGVERFLAQKGLNGIAMSKGEKALQMRIAGMSWDDRFSYGKTFWRVRETIPFDVRARAINSYAENPEDGATPSAIAQALIHLQKGELLSPASTDFMLQMMHQSKTGPRRLRGGLSHGWKMAHKTGTGQVLKLLATGYNDVGILTSPDGRHYAVSVMIGATNRPVKERQALMQAVTKAVIACAQSGDC